MTAVPNIEKIGFFHFGKNHLNPINELRKALVSPREQPTNIGGVRNSLIVLPEGFNIKKPYFHMKHPDTDPSIILELATVSAEFECTFIAGLIIRESPTDPQPPYNAAYLIDGFKILERLCVKEGRDATEITEVRGNTYVANYTAASNFENRVRRYRGLSFVAAICMDCYEASGRSQDNNPKVERVVTNLVEEPFPRIVCMPAHTGNGYDRLIGQTKPGLIHVVANSNKDRDSSVTLRQSSQSQVKGHVNLVHVCRLDSLN